MNRLIFMFVLALGAATARAQALPASSVLLDSYAAIVNGRVITLGDVLAALQPVQERLALQYRGAELENRILEEYNTLRNALVESELILVDFEMQGGALPDRAIEDHVNSVIHERFNNNRAEFLRALAAERLTYADWRKQMKEQLVVQIMRQREVTSKILVTPLDLQQAYERQRDRYTLPERVRLRTLALGRAGSKAEQPDLLERAGAIRAGVLAGDRELAGTEGPLVMDDAEWLDTASLTEPIRAALAGLAPGGIAEPVDIAGEIFLVQLVEHQPARIRPLEEVAPEIERELRRAEFDRLNRIWVDSLRAKYFVQLFSHNLFD
jgi:peptidyl-prolyl cis-trans isomerase SurA